MNVRSAYESIGADYEGVRNRLMSDALVERFAEKFLEDPSFARLEEAVRAGDARAAFTAAHTLKGVCQNLGLVNLLTPTVQLTEALRDAIELGDAPALLDAVRSEYDKTVSALRSCA